MQIVSKGLQGVMESIHLSGIFFQFVHYMPKKKEVDQTVQFRLSFLLEVAETVSGGLLQPTDWRQRQRNRSLHFTEDTTGSR